MRELGDHDSFLQSLQDDAMHYDQNRTSFLAEAENVLIWHYDLANGGTPITKPSRFRNSRMTHFIRASDEQFYRRSSQYHQAESGAHLFTSVYYDVPATV